MLPTKYSRPPDAISRFNLVSTVVVAAHAVEKYHNPVKVSPATPSGVPTTGPSGSASRTGLASLPPLNPEVAQHRMTVTTVPARVTDEVFRLYLKYQVSTNLPSDLVHWCQAPWHANSANCVRADFPAGYVNAGCRIYYSYCISFLDVLEGRGRVGVGRSDRTRNTYFSSANFVFFLIRFKYGMHCQFVLR